MNSLALRRWLANVLVSLIPPTRGYLVKRLIWRFGQVSVAPRARIVSSVRIWTAGPVSIGEDTFIGHEVLITGGAASIHIGNHCDIAPRVTIAGGSHEEGTGNRAAGKGISKAIAIQDGVWLGAGVTVLGGVSIGAGAIIGAGSLVSKDVTEDTVAAGVPCAFIRQRTQNEECRS